MLPIRSHSSTLDCGASACVSLLPVTSLASDCDRFDSHHRQ
ncbi:MAG TPA: hypothetical protein VN420_00525 [Candidatus Fimivivens sp.]|nr:hypothetical protein [Candidatus Fimivivens sp.]